MLELAQRDLKAASESPQADASVLADLGAVLFNLGRAAPAIAAYTQALERSPGELQILIDRGWANDALKQLDAAARDLESVLRASPTNAEALAGLGYVRARQRQDIDAQRNASLAILHAADDYRILHNVACIYAELSRSTGAMKAEQEDTPLNLLRAALDRSQTIGGNESVAIQSEPAFVGTINQRQEFRELLSR